MEFRDDQAIYLQIADHFCENILLEKWKPGDRIPSVREMAVSIEVNPNTVMRTFTYLQEKGIIYNKRGIGYFVAEDGKIKTSALKKDDFISNELPRLFKAMDILHLSIEDLSKYYQQHLKTSENA
ncbi:MAG: GntR family transcriptional regulator [Reichenbachiella sp.]|uniref:GntR family transcriptional regulator n=1 Tax=Reichenbachiella sp. TaxID=2184521 RepID=UPI003296D668